MSEFDTGVPHIARVYDYWLGGTDNFAADRELGERTLQAYPDLALSVRANRAFLARAVRFLAAEAGIRQFLDLGTWLPTANNTHEVAQSVAPDSRIVYVDNDPLVLVHARALLTSAPQGSCDYLETDLRNTTAVLAGSAQTLDLSRPVAVLLLAVLHFLADSDDPAGVVAALARRLAPGSFGDLPPDRRFCARPGGRRGRGVPSPGPKLAGRAQPRPGQRPVRRPAAGAARSGPHHRMAARYRQPTPSCCGSVCRCGPHPGGPAMTGRRL